MASIVRNRLFRIRTVLAAAIFAATGVAYRQLPAIGAGALLHPARSRVAAALPEHCQETSILGMEVTLAGWSCRAPAPPRVGTLVYLHGIADNRASARGAIAHFGGRGYDVLAFDSRAHGESGGDACTYGPWETQDLRRILDTISGGPIVLFGVSLGAAVAIQHAAVDERVSAVVAAETFSDLETVARERALWFFTSRAIAQSFQQAELRGRFRVSDASPVSAAARVRVPVLLIHGAADIDTPPDHSQRVLNALGGPKRLLLVPGAGHNQSLQPEMWVEIGTWLSSLPQLRESASHRTAGST